MKIAVNNKYRRKSDWQGSDAVANNRSLNRAKWVVCSAFVHLHFQYSGTSMYMNSLYGSQPRLIVVYTMRFIQNVKRRFTFPTN